MLVEARQVVLEHAVVDVKALHEHGEARDPKAAKAKRGVGDELFHDEERRLLLAVDQEERSHRGHALAETHLGVVVGVGAENVEQTLLARAVALSVHDVVPQRAVNVEVDLVLVHLGRWFVEHCLYIFLFSF